MIQINKQFFAISESGTNYIKFSDGTLICYGQFLIPAGSSSTTVTLPYPFASNWSYSVNITNLYSYSGDCIWSVSALYTNSFQVHVQTISSTNVQRDGLWIAIGKWK